MLKKQSYSLSPDKTDTLIGMGTTIEGKIISEASLRVEGLITGDIECSGDVIVGENGHVQSDIRARNVVNAGRIEGSIECQDKLTITPTGKVIGYIRAEKLSIAEGAFFEGTSKMKASDQNKQDMKEIKSISAVHNKIDEKSHAKEKSTAAI